MPSSVAGFCPCPKSAAAAPNRTARSPSLVSGSNSFGGSFGSATASSTARRRIASSVDRSPLCRMSRSEPSPSRSSDAAAMICSSAVPTLARSRRDCRMLSSTACSWVFCATLTAERIAAIRTLCWESASARKSRLTTCVSESDRFSLVTLRVVVDRTIGVSSPSSATADSRTDQLSSSRACCAHSTPPPGLVSSSGSRLVSRSSAPASVWANRTLSRRSSSSRPKSCPSLRSPHDWIPKAARRRSSRGRWGSLSTTRSAGKNDGSSTLQRICAAAS